MIKSTFQFCKKKKKKKREHVPVAETENNEKTTSEM